MAAILVVLPFAAGGAEIAGRGDLARELLQGCLSGPNKDATTRLAMAIGATPYTPARLRRERAHQDTSVVVDDITRPDEAQRTETAVTAFVGWDLPGPGAGSLDYSESRYRMTRVEMASGQPIQPWRVARIRACEIAAPVANTRAIFELYQTLQSWTYGILVSPDRRRVQVLTFDPDRYDIELCSSCLSRWPACTPTRGQAPPSAAWC